MTPRRLAVALLLALISIPSSARAADGDIQYREWLNQCSPGAIQGCASISLRLEYLAATNETAISMSASNLQGLPGYTHLLPSYLSGVRFQGLEFSGRDPGQGLSQGEFVLPPNGSLLFGTAVTGNASLDGLYGEITWALYGLSIERCTSRGTGFKAGSHSPIRPTRSSAGAPRLQATQHAKLVPPA
jgi:hypothetical protein